MSLAKIEQNEETRLIFDVNVSGTKEDVSQYRFVIESENYSIVCKGVPTKDGIEVQVPKLKHLLDEGVYKTSLEIIIGDKIFTPLTEVLEVLPNVELRVENKTPEEPAKEEIKVEVGQTKVKSIIQEAKEEGYTIVSSGDKTILKKDGGYIGIIENDTMVLADKPHDFLTDLFEELK